MVGKVYTNLGQLMSQWYSGFSPPERLSTAAQDLKHSKTLGFTRMDTKSSARKVYLDMLSRRSW